MTMRLWELVGKRGKTLRTGREMWWGDGCCHLVLSSVTKYSSRFSETLNHHLEIVLAVRGRLSIVLYSSVGGRSRRERFSEVAFKETGNRWRVEKVPLFPMCLSWGQNGWWCGAGGLLRIFSLSPTVLFHPFHTGRMCDKMNKNPPSVSKRVYIYIYWCVYYIYNTQRGRFTNKAALAAVRWCGVAAPVARWRWGRGTRQYSPSGRKKKWQLACRFKWK